MSYLAVTHMSHDVQGDRGGYEVFVPRTMLKRDDMQSGSAAHDECNRMP